MLINLRNALMAGKRLPYDAEVEYLQSTGTQYIDTGVVPAPMLDYSISFAFTSMSSYSYLMGAWSSNNSNYYDLAEQSNTLLYAGLGTTQQAIANIPVGVFSTVEKRGLEIYVDGVKKKTFSADIQSGSISSTILLFGVHRNYGPGYIVAAQPLRISAFSLKSNGVLVRDYIPVRVGQVGYLYDRVSGKLFGNAGTGDFVLGQDVVPVEYIESTGTEYIDTGVPANSNLRVRAKFESRMDTLDIKWFFLGRDNAVAGDGFGFGVFNGYATSDYNGRISSQIDKFPTGTVVVIDKNKSDCSYNNHSLINTSTTFSYTSHLPIWGLISAGSFTANATLASRCYYFNIDDDGNPIRRYRPVRVGTDATSWEGAMMDTLTRRIYRNAGTGAFGYGNDLKYPIPSE